MRQSKMKVQDKNISSVWTEVALLEITVKKWVLVLLSLHLILQAHYIENLVVVTKVMDGVFLQD